MKNFNEIKLRGASSLFKNVPNNIAICINESNTQILSQLKTKNCYIIDCNIDWQINQKK